MRSGDASPIRFHVIGRYLHVETDEEGFYVVSDATLQRARQAGERGVAECFGDLRRQGDLTEIERRLSDYDSAATLTGYVEEIERSIGCESGNSDIAARLASLGDVEFAGASTVKAEYPADWEDFRTESERDAEWEDPEAQIIAQATMSDLPAEFVKKYCRSSSDMFGTDVDEYVPAELIDELVAALRAEGHEVTGDVDAQE